MPASFAMRRALVVSVWLGVAVLGGCEDEVTLAPPIDAHIPPLPPRDAGAELCAAEGPLDASVPRVDLDLCAEGIVPMGFGLRWQSQSERLARFAVRLDVPSHAPSDCGAGATLRGATLEVVASAGTSAERPPAVVFLDYQVLGPSEPGAPPSDAGVPVRRTARGAVTVELAAGMASGEGLALVDLAAAGLDGATHFMVAIDGLDFTTELPQGTDFPLSWNPANGYASRGIGASIGAVERDGNTLRVRAAARFEHGTLGQPTLEAGHDEATRFARRRATVRFVVVASDVEVARGAVTQLQEARASDPLEGGAPCRGEGELALQGVAGLERGVVGLTRFDVALWPDEERVGDRLRELSVRVRELEYDPAAGRAELRVEAYASNEGPFPRRGLIARSEVEVALAQWNGGGEVVPVSIAAPLTELRRAVPLALR